MRDSPYLEQFIEQTLAQYRPGALFTERGAVKRLPPPLREEFIDPGDVYEDLDDDADA